MDEIRRLEREIVDLQKQLNQQNSEANRVRQQLVDENRKNLQAVQNDMRAAISNHDKKTQEEFERLLNQYQTDLNNDVQFELSKMDANYRQLLNDVERSRAELIKKNQELELAITEIRNDVSRKNEGSSQEAKKYLQNAKSAFRLIDEKPHEKFFPKRLKVFGDTIKNGQELLNAGLFEAATAVAISSRSGLERLGYSIDDKASEWDNQYELLVIKLNYLQEKVKQEIEDWKEFAGTAIDGEAEDAETSLIQINYWSKGNFEEIVQGIEKYNELVAEVNGMGKAAYLKKQGGASIADIKEYISDIDRLGDRFAELSGLYKQRYSASCERAEWGEKIIDFLTEEINLVWIDELTGFKEATESELKSKNFTEYVHACFKDIDIAEDTREWLKIVFENASENQIFIYILPIENDGFVENRIIIHIDYNGPEQKMYSRDIYQHVCEAVAYVDNGDGTVEYTNDTVKLKLSENKMLCEAGKDIERIKQRK